MSQENVEVVRRCYELMANREFSAFPEVAHPALTRDFLRYLDSWSCGCLRGLSPCVVLTRR
jgi:hypothetical protein